MPKAKKEDTGRPTKYKEEYCEQIIEFFNKDPYEAIEIEVTDDDGNVRKTVATDKSGDPILKPCQLPTKEGFAISIGVHRETLINWAKAHPEFFDAIKTCEMMQENILVQNSLIKAYDKTFAIFTAKNVMGWSDKGQSDYINVDLSKCKTPLDKANKVVLEASKGRVALDKAASFVSTITHTLKIEEVTTLKEELQAIKEKLGLADV